jgi:hypothetical protein
MDVKDVAYELVHYIHLAQHKARTLMNTVNECSGSITYRVFLDYMSD